MTHATDSAPVLTDPQNDLLSEDGAAWELVGPSVQDNGTIDNIERLLQGAKGSGTRGFAGAPAESAASC